MVLTDDLTANNAKQYVLKRNESHLFQEKVAEGRKEGIVTTDFDFLLNSGRPFFLPLICICRHCRPFLLEPLPQHLDQLTSLPCCHIT